MVINLTKSNISSLVALAKILVAMIEDLAKAHILHKKKRK
jgi:hypothetical protein